MPADTPWPDSHTSKSPNTTQQILKQASNHVVPQPTSKPPPPLHPSPPPLHCPPLHSRPPTRPPHTHTHTLCHCALAFASLSVAVVESGAPAFQSDERQADLRYISRDGLALLLGHPRAGGRPPNLAEALVLDLRRPDERALFG